MNQKIPLQPTRQILLDTETTGISEYGAPYEGHCIIEIGAVEMINRRYTGRKLHLYIKPDREVDIEAIQIHGITDKMLEDKPSFPEIAQEFVEFIKGAELIIHNAPFDVGFMDYEFRKHNIGVQTEDICVVTDTLAMARKSYPGKRNSLDALCERFNIDNSARTLHGALLDAEILGDVYLAMTGGQTSLFDDADQNRAMTAEENRLALQGIDVESLAVIHPSEEEAAEHQKYLEFINKKSNNRCIWCIDDAEEIKN